MNTASIKETTDTVLEVKGVAVVILNWNGRHFLEKFLPALLRSVECFNTKGILSEGRSEVIVADNASDDGSMEMMRQSFPDVRTLILDRNYGFTGGYNKAFERIRCKYFLLINSDIEVPENWLEPLAEWMERESGCGICAPKLHSWQDKDMFEYAGAAGGYIDRYGFPFCRGRVLKRLERDEGQYDEPADVFWATGACLMIRSSVYSGLGGLDERFFAHMEEIDLCWRAQLAGWRVCVVPQSTVYHIGGGTLPQDSPWKLYLNFRNNLLMLDNNLAKTYALEEVKRQKKDGDKVDLMVAAVKGTRKARRTIMTRMLIDGCAAAMYLLSLKPGYFRSVIKAHKDFRRLRTVPEPGAITDYLKKNENEEIKIQGFYRGWMIPHALSGRKMKF